MKQYVVGGWVRDKLLGIEPNDKDFVVVGSTPEEMLSLKFERVGLAFPVFLHPVTKDEYALARTEKKVGNGYNGFTCEYMQECLDDVLLEKFKSLGYNTTDEYTIEELLKVLRHISQ